MTARDNNTNDILHNLALIIVMIDIYFEYITKLTYNLNEQYK